MRNTQKIAIIALTPLLPLASAVAAVRLTARPATDSTPLAVVTERSASDVPAPTGDGTPSTTATTSPPAPATSTTTATMPAPKSAPVKPAITAEPTTTTTTEPPSTTTTVTSIPAIITTTTTLGRMYCSAYYTIPGAPGPLHNGQYEDRVYAVNGSLSSTACEPASAKNGGTWTPKDPTWVWAAAVCCFRES